MDELERKVFNLDPVGSRAHDRAVRGARQAWEITTGQKPAYVEVIKTTHGINKDKYLVEVDGVRISAFDATCYDATGLGHYWNIDERWFPRIRLTLRALDDDKLLQRRRRRLRKRGLYNG